MSNQLSSISRAHRSSPRQERPFENLKSSEQPPGKKCIVASGTVWTGSLNHPKHEARHPGAQTQEVVGQDPPQRVILAGTERAERGPELMPFSTRWVIYIAKPGLFQRMKKNPERGWEGAEGLFFSLLTEYEDQRNVCLSGDVTKGNTLLLNMARYQMCRIRLAQINSTPMSIDLDGHQDSMDCFSQCRLAFCPLMFTFL